MTGSPNWHVWLGLGLTTAWLLLGTIYISAVIGWGQQTTAAPNLADPAVTGIHIDF